MLRIRLRRTGKKKQASYRVVVADQRAPRDGDYVEVLGHYNPRTEPSTLEVDEDRVRHWLGEGAQPSDTLHRLFHDRGWTTVEPPKRPTRPSKAEVAAQRQAEESRAEAAAAAEAAATAAETPEAEETTTEDAAE